MMIIFGVNIFLLLNVWDEDSYRDHETGELEGETSNYPLYLKGRNPLSDTHYLPPLVRLAYRESINALKNDCRLLATAGFRTVIEAVCYDKGIKGDELQSKIDKLNSKGFLSKAEADRLHAVRFLGNGAIHEIKVHNEKDLQSALIIIEHLLLNLYLIDKMISIDKVITEYRYFEELLDSKIGDFKKGEQVGLKKILGRSRERISVENLELFEKKLQKKITDGKYTEIGIGDIETIKEKGKPDRQLQKYIILIDKPIDPMEIIYRSFSRTSD